MSEYQRSTSFFDWSTQNPTKPVRGVDLDREFDNIGAELKDLKRMLGKIQRADGRLANGVTYIDSCAQELLDLISKYGGSGVYIPEEPGEGGDNGTGATVESGAGTLLHRGLLDTPDTYQGAGGHQVIVAETEDGLVFREIPEPEIRLQDATDIPDLEGNGGRVLAVAEGEEGFTFQVLNIEPGALYARLDADNDFQGKKQSNMLMGAYKEDVIDLGQISGNVAIDPAASNVFQATITGDTTFTWLNNAGVQKVYSCTMRLTIVGENAITWFAGAKWGYETVQEGDPPTTIERAKSAPKIYADADMLFTWVRFPDGVSFGFVQ